MSKRTNIAKGVAGGCAAVALSVSMLSGCGRSEDKTTTAGAGDAIETESVATDDQSNVTGSENSRTVTSDGSMTGMTGSGDMGTSSAGAPSDKDGGMPRTPVSDVTEISAYATLVGYFPEAGNDTRLIGNAAAWDDYVDSVSRVVYSDDGETAIRPVGLKEYENEFFAKGNRLLVRYQDLPTGSANPKVTSWSIDGDAVVVEWDDGIAQDMMVTADMSGFVTVAEIPVGTNVTQIKFPENIR